MIPVYVLAGVVLLALLGAAMSVRIIKQYERVVLFELGKVKDGARGPGLPAASASPSAPGSDWNEAALEGVANQL